MFSPGGRIILIANVAVDKNTLQNQLYTTELVSPDTEEPVWYKGERKGLGVIDVGLNFFLLLV